MPECIDSKWITNTRKPYSCWGCANTFPVGSSMRRVTSVEDGRISSVYWCRVCNLFIGTLETIDREGGFDYGELARGDGYPKEAQG